MLKGRIADGSGTNREAYVTEKNALKVQIVPETSKGLPPEDLASIRLLRDYLLNSTGASNMNVNGSVTPVEFKISSSVNITKWITGIRILLEDANLEINTIDFRRFGTATAASTPLTNGVQIEAFQSGETTSISVEPITILGDFLNYADSFTNLVNSISATEDFILFDINFDKPIVLASGGNDTLLIRIRDNLTAINSFKCIAKGYKETV